MCQSILYILITRATNTLLKIYNIVYKGLKTLSIMDIKRNFEV